MVKLRAPFPWFGGKSTVADEIWSRFGAIKNYVEPFCGSAAVLLSRPDPDGVETINDADGWVANFWRAVRLAPDEVAQWADYPVSEVDLIARHRWLCQQDFIERLKNDPDYCDPKLAGWWVWGQCAWIGAGWCDSPQTEQLPHLGNAGMGINRRLPHLGNAGRGKYILQQMEGLASRLRDVRIACGDWTRVLGPSVTTKHSGVTGVFLDPPYADDEHSIKYAGGAAVWEDICKWCEAHGGEPNMRVALCGYDGTWNEPPGWSRLQWKAAGGYGSQGDGRGKANARRETIWFSPGCLGDLPLFLGATPEAQEE